MQLPFIFSHILLTVMHHSYLNKITEGYMQIHLVRMKDNVCVRVYVYMCARVCCITGQSANSPPHESPSLQGWRASVVGVVLSVSPVYAQISEGLWGEIQPTDLLKCPFFTTTVQKLWFQCDFVRTLVKSVPGRWFECFGGGDIVTLTSPLSGKVAWKHSAERAHILCCGYIRLSRCQSGNKVSKAVRRKVHTNGTPVASFLPPSLSLVTQIYVMLVSSPTQMCC